MNTNLNDDVNVGADAQLQRGLARADFSRFLSACFYQPDALFAQENMFESMHLAALSISPESMELAVLTRELGSSFAANSLEELLVDYSKLFIGPSEIFARPYESVWIKEGRGFLMQESTQAVTKMYEEGGFVISDEFYGPPDHVAIELEFLYLLLYQEAQKRACADAAGANAIQQLHEQFLAQHLGQWFFAFSSFFSENAQSDFYRNLAKVGSAFIELEMSGSCRCSCH